MEILALPPATNRADRRAAWVEVFVRKLIGDLRADCPPFIGNQNVNDEYLKDLSKLITKLKRLLRNLPAHLSTVLFSPELFWPLYKRQGTALGINPNTRKWLAQRTPARKALLVELLDWLQAQSNDIRHHGLGMHGSVNYQGLQAAIASREVIERAAENYPGRKLSLSCALTSDYHRIARLFYEAATGEHDRDLRHACESVAPPLRTKQ